MSCKCGQFCVIRIFSGSGLVAGRIVMIHSWFPAVTILEHLLRINCTIETLRTKLQLTVTTHLPHHTRLHHTILQAIKHPVIKQTTEATLQGKTYLTN